MARSASSTARGSDAASLKSERTNNLAEVHVEQNCLVDSDDEGLLSAEELEWALAQRSTDPFIKQRLQKGRFMFVKIAGCEGFHCYESELLARLEGLGMDLLGPAKAQATSEARAAAEAAAAAAKPLVAAKAAACSNSMPEQPQDSSSGQLTHHHSSQGRTARKHKHALQQTGKAAADSMQQQHYSKHEQHTQPNMRHRQREGKQQEQQQNEGRHRQAQEQQQEQQFPTALDGQQRRQRQRWHTKAGHDDEDMSAAKPASMHRSA